MPTTRHLTHLHLTTPDGWRLRMRRVLPLGRPPGGPPVLLVHGFGLNSLVFHLHPNGPSLAESLAVAGLDPWSLDLRGTTSSTPPPGQRRTDARLADMAFVDLPAATALLQRVTGHARHHAIGCSLGGALLYAHAGRDAHHLASLVTMGSPLEWVTKGTVVAAFSKVGEPLARVPVRGSRTLARWGLPIVRRLGPDLLSFYLNPRLTDCRPAHEIVRVIEDPLPDANRKLAAWIRDGRLHLDGHDVSAGLATVYLPTALLYATGDGIVPPEVALAAADRLPTPPVLVPVRHAEHRVSHVDLFLGRHVHEAVHPPLVDFLLAQPPTR